MFNYLRKFKPGDKVDIAKFLKDSFEYGRKAQVNNVDFRLIIEQTNVNGSSEWLECRLNCDEQNNYWFEAGPYSWREP